MADRTVLTSASDGRKGLRVLTWLLWVVFMAGNAIVLVLQYTPPSEFMLVLSMLLLLFLFLIEIGLLVRYWRWVGQWRAVVIFWSSYSLLRVLVDQGNARGWAEVTLAAMMLVLYAGLAGWLALAALALRRDVSVAYVVLAFAIGPIVLRAQIVQAGEFWFGCKTNRPARRSRALPWPSRCR
ncbi:MAG: hypothetical protein HZY76_22985 [Anaerolineae bacterium]|nr:MAG: hypothetical protein HZY76_22985 [Anaerolineae bacterium]